GRPAPYGRVLWPTAAAVAARVLALPIGGRRLLELGCGTGLVSLVAARAGARVTATDVDAGSLAAVAPAAFARGVDVSTAIVDVMGAEPLPSPFDVLVAADLLYEDELASAVARRALEARARGAVIVVGDPGRVFRSTFLAALHTADVEARFEAAGDVG